MILSQWTPRRIALIWIAGLALQVVLIVALVVSAMRDMRTEGPRLRREVAALNAHYTAAERADSVSRAEQVASARRDGNFYLRADGQTVFAVVGMPSRRPDAQSMDELRASMNARVAVLFGAIPLALVTLTLAWFFARRPNRWRPAV